MWAKHRVGEPIVCNMGKCDNKDFSHPSSLKQHQRTVHKGDYKFECHKCPYKTDSGSTLTSHLFLKHKIIEKDEEDQPVVYTCELCTKEFPAQHLLTKHMKDKNCVKKKIALCGLRWFKVKCVKISKKDVKLSKRCQVVKKMSNVKK